MYKLPVRRGWNHTIASVYCANMARDFKELLPECYMFRGLRMNNYVLDFSEIDHTELTLVGGKGANLGELSQIEGIRVPEGFCVTTEAYQRTIWENRDVKDLMDRLSTLKSEDRNAVAEISSEIRGIIEGAKMADDIREEITRHLSELGKDDAYAVRSSATAEDLPLASFAGQQDTFLNILGEEAVLRHISKCWASLFTDRAVIYRMRNGFDHRKVYLSVVVQRMVFPQAAGILFTADPVTSNRKVVSIDTSFGLGEALVSGLVNPDQYKVQGGKIIKKKVSAKKAGVYSLPGGGTEVREIEPPRRNTQTLTDRSSNWSKWAGRSRSILPAPRTLNGALTTMRSTSFRAAPLPPYSRYLR